MWSIKNHGNKLQPLNSQVILLVSRSSCLLLCFPPAGGSIILTKYKESKAQTSASMPRAWLCFSALVCYIFVRENDIKLTSSLWLSYNTEPESQTLRPVWDMTETESTYISSTTGCCDLTFNILMVVVYHLRGDVWTISERGVADSTETSSLNKRQANF